MKIFPFCPSSVSFAPPSPRRRKGRRSFRAQPNRRAPEESSVSRDGTAAAFDEERRNKLGSFCKRVAHHNIIFYFLVAFLLSSFELEFGVLWLLFQWILLLLELRFCGFLLFASFLALFIGCCYLQLSYVSFVCSLRSPYWVVFFPLELQFGVVIKELAR
jgi:hypothetical protein